MKSAFAVQSAEPRRPHFLSVAPLPARVPEGPFVPATQADGILERLATSRLAEPPPLPPPVVTLPAAANEPPPGRRKGDARLAQAIERLQLRGAQLAEEARADVVELAFAMARRILEGELHASHDAIFALVRSAVRRVGEARRIEVRVAPADAAALQAAVSAGAAGLVTLTPVTVVADPSLAPGDCTVDSDAGLVDGRLGERLAELRRAVDLASEESAA